MGLFETTKELIQDFIDNGWNGLINKVNILCTENDIDSPDMDSLYVAGKGCFRRQIHDVTTGHHYRFDIFHEVVDKQLQEMNYRFSENVMDLLILSLALDSRENFKFFKVDDIYKLIDRFYPKDFIFFEKEQLPYELRLFEFGVIKNHEFGDLSTLSELCHEMVKKGKVVTYPLTHRIICLLVTLPVSITTNERAFSAMKLIKTKFCTKMEDEYLEDSMIIYIEKDIASSFSTYSIIEDFTTAKPRRSDFGIVIFTI